MRAESEVAGRHRKRIERVFGDAVMSMRVGVYDRMERSGGAFVEVSEAIPVESGFDALHSPLADALGGAFAEAFGIEETALKAGRVPVSDIGRQIAAEWAQTEAARLVVKISKKTREAIRDAISLGIRERWDVPEIAKAVRDVVGLAPRDARALAAMRKRLMQLDLDAEVIDRRLARRAAGMLRRRADLIARTEVKAAVSLGKEEEWWIALNKGQVPPTVHVQWRAGDGCPLCRRLARLPPVPLGEPFKDDESGVVIHRPPAHPRCRCDIVLLRSRRGMQLRVSAPLLKIRPLVFRPLRGEA